MTIQELKERMTAIRPLFGSRGQEIKDFGELRMGRVFRINYIDGNKRSFIFTPLGGWDRHNRGFGSSFMRIKRLDGKIDTIVDLDFLMGAAVIIRLA
jgi:hypothetical protein